MKHPIKGRIIALSGSSGVGKNALIENVRIHAPHVQYFLSCTTREMRPHESQGNPYYFLTSDQFKEKIADSDFLEWESIHNNLYGIDSDSCLQALNKGDILIKDLGVGGALKLKGLFGASATIIFVKPPSIDALRERLVLADNRTDIDLRLRRYQEELSHAHLFDYLIVNDNLQKATSILLNIIEAELRNP